MAPVIAGQTLLDAVLAGDVEPLAFRQVIVVPGSGASLRQAAIGLLDLVQPSRQFS